LYGARPGKSAGGGGACGGVLDLASIEPRGKGGGAVGGVRTRVARRGVPPNEAFFFILMGLV
jgi:hypothetical protein